MNIIPDPKEFRWPFKLKKTLSLTNDRVSFLHSTVKSILSLFGLLVSLWITVLLFTDISQNVLFFKSIKYAGISLLAVITIIFLFSVYQQFKPRKLE